MSSDSSEDQPAERNRPRDPTDHFLIARMITGDVAALRKLMERYDRLVRFAGFRAAKDRCRQDPQWLDSIASETWAGFVQSMRRDPDNPPTSLAAYLVRTARNRTISALRRARSEDGATRGGDVTDAATIPAIRDDPAEELCRVEQIEALRECLAQLDSAGQRLAGQLQAITERRWRDAASALGLKESTLRSRWKQVIVRLRRCIRRKMGEAFAPGSLSGDSLCEGGESVERGGRP